jgi:hypothetical protein
MADARARDTLYVRTWRLWPILLLLLSPALIVIARRRAAR